MITLEAIKARLAHFRYEAASADDGMLTYIQTTVVQSTLLALNISVIPEDVEHIVIDKICGEFLMTKKSTGQSVGIDVATGIKSIQEGDTTITYDTATSPEAQLDMLLKWLISGRDGVLLRHRCIRW